MQASITLRNIVTGFAIIVLGTFAVGSKAFAVEFNMPTQSNCDNGSTTLTWEGEGVSRPVVASMTVDGEAIADPANPDEDSLGVVVCPSTTKGNRTSVTVVYHTAEGNTSDLSIATTPSGDPVTASTQIAITMSDLGTNAAHFTFSLVYGAISSWTTANLKTASASVSYTISPVRTPQGGNSSDFDLCSAVPPDCHAVKSDSDVLGATVGLSFEPGVGTNMVGSYFAMTGAMGGYVTSATATDGSKTLVATLGAPHFLADGATLNTGSMTAFLPQAVVNSLFGLTNGDVDTTTLDVTRTTGTTTTSNVPFTIQAVTGGITVTVPTITFSTPKYTIKMTAAGLKKQKANATTPSASKSTVKVVGQNIKANGKSVYRLEVTVRNKLGKVLKVTPVVTSSSAMTIHKPVLKSNTSIITVSVKRPGVKTITIKASGVTLKIVTVTFIKA